MKLIDADRLQPVRELLDEHIRLWADNGRELSECSQVRLALIALDDAIAYADRKSAAEQAVVEAVFGLTAPQIEMLTNHASRSGHSANLRDTLLHLRAVKARALDKLGEAVCYLLRGHSGSHEACTRYATGKMRILRKLRRFIRRFDIRCFPLLACARHGRCMRHARWS